MINFEKAADVSQSEGLMIAELYERNCSEWNRDKLKSLSDVEFKRELARTSTRNFES
jgi:hypothetical protein